MEVAGKKGEQMSSYVLIKDIEVDTALQTRVRRNDSVVDEYAIAMMDGAKFPPIVLFDDGNKKYLSDGFHRYTAALSSGRDRIEAEIHSGDKHAGFLYSIKANSTHGLRRTLEDKRHVVTLLLNDFEYADRSDREIAVMCNVSHPFVSKVRAELNRPASSNKFTPANRSHKWHRDRTNEVETLPPLGAEQYDPRDDVLSELARENDQLNDRLSVQAMDATDEEKTLAADTISALREEYRLLTLECNAVKHSRNTYMHQAAEAITQCKINQRTIAKLNKTVEVLQKELATFKTPSQGY
jgi:hypothetical protein